MLSRCGDSLLTLSPIYCDAIASVRIRESMTSHGHMTHQEKGIFRGSGDEDLLTLSLIYCDVIAIVIIHCSRPVPRIICKPQDNNTIQSIYTKRPIATYVMP